MISPLDPINDFRLGSKCLFIYRYLQHPYNNLYIISIHHHHFSVCQFVCSTFSRKLLILLSRNFTRASVIIRRRGLKTMGSVACIIMQKLASLCPQNWNFLTCDVFIYRGLRKFICAKLYIFSIFHLFVAPYSRAIQLPHECVKSYIYFWSFKGSDLILLEY